MENNTAPENRRIKKLPELAAPTKAEDVPQISLQDIAADEIRQKIEAADINSMTPIEALNFLSRLKEMV